MFALRALPRGASMTSTFRHAFSTTTPRSLSKMQIIGRLVDAPELQHTSTGRDLVKYRLAVSTGPKDDQGNRATSYYELASFAEGGSRELLLNLQKGTRVYVEADANYTSYTAGDGTARKALNLVQRTFEPLDRPQRAGGEGETTGAESNAASAAQEPLRGVGQS